MDPVDLIEIVVRSGNAGRAWRYDFIHQGCGSKNDSVVAQSVWLHSGHGSAWLKPPRPTH